MYLLVFLLSFVALAQPPALPPPARTGGRPLYEALTSRQTAREFSTQPLPPATLSQLLWAAQGVNRPATGGRTAPSAHGWNVIDIYVALAQGLYRFDPAAHSLIEVASDDARAIAGTQDFTATAPLNLIYVARMEKMRASAEDTPEDLLAWAAVEAGAIAQNVGLYCAAEGLASVVRAGVQRPAFAKLARLPATHKILLAQTIGYPARKLVWADEFNTGDLPDPARWTYEEGFIRNREQQFYTKGRRENARIENGVLIIEARREADQAGKPRITSASLTTEGKASWTHGRIEVRAKLPTGRGTWPAIWMLGNNHRTAGWPLCGEIDIMENVGFNPTSIHANVHTRKYNHAQNTGKGNKIIITKPWDEFHIYTVDWNPARMEFFVDGVSYFTYANEGAGVEVWPFDQPFYLILNLAIGGAWGGREGVDETLLPHRYEIDYVRVYQ